MKNYLLLILVIIIVVAALFFLNQYNYLLYHCIIELLAATVAITIFSIGWNSYKFAQNNMLLILAVAYLIVGVLDILHALSYPGMGVFPLHDKNLSGQLLISARYVESLSICFAVFSLGKKQNLRAKILLASYVITGICLVVAIFVPGLFPVCYVNGMGATPFKVISRYIISVLFGVAAFWLWRNRILLQRHFFNHLLLSMGTTVLAEFCFSLYAVPYSFLAFWGHILKFVSVILIYAVLVEGSLKNPYELLLMDLRRSEGILRLALYERERAEEVLQKARGEWEKRAEERTLELKQLNEDLAAEIEERKRAEMALREREEQFLQIIERHPSAVFIHINNKIVFANTAAANLTNVPSPQVLVGKSLVDYIHPEYLEMFRQHMHQITENKPLEKSVEAKIVQTGGTIVDVEYVLTPISYRGNQAVQTMIRNITERKKMEEELLKANKIDSFCLLAGGIAHDLNNILAVILGNVSLAKSYIDKNDKNDKVFQKLQNVKKAIQQAKDLTRQLQTFSKGGEPVKKTVSIVKFLKEITVLSLSGSNVTCAFSFPDYPMLVEIDEGQISQVISNLIINAVCAMPEGGRIFVSASAVKVEGGSSLPLEEGKYVKISIKDEGTGIAEEHIHKIFDPFFSTKPEGSGLGLAISYSIIRKHNGYITVESEIDVGTTFHIYLPVSLEASAVRKEKEEDFLPGRENFCYGR